MTGQSRGLFFTVCTIRSVSQILACNISEWGLFCCSQGIRGPPGEAGSSGSQVQLFAFKATYNVLMFATLMSIDGMQVYYILEKTIMHQLLIFFKHFPRHKMLQQSDCVSPHNVLFSHWFHIGIDLSFVSGAQGARGLPGQKGSAGPKGPPVSEHLS